MDFQLQAAVSYPNDAAANGAPANGAHIYIAGPAAPGAANAAGPNAGHAAAPQTAAPAVTAVPAGPPSPARGAFAQVMLRYAGVEITVPPGSREDLVLNLADRMLAAASQEAGLRAPAPAANTPAAEPPAAEPSANPPAANTSAAANGQPPASADSTRQEFFSAASSPRGGSPPGSVDRIRVHVAEAIAAQVPPAVAAQLPRTLRRVERGVENLRGQFADQHEMQRRVAQAVLVVTGELDLVASRLAWGEQIRSCRRHRDLRAVDMELVQHFVEGRMPVGHVVALHRQMLARRQELQVQANVRTAFGEVLDQQDPAVVNEFNFELTRALRDTGANWM
ncbi:hypothetical protein K490DRAFT_63995 [Saccharata proteae CBS 121410]|uniref:Uncharacterized protein n=1 Tax=Saccharata proteae CBS 121410 TaxID=1314787 RepID=A0A6A5YAA9_9PEZI|nr:hypothetical protein K490DRAFT_63995 [Saccharata proteae CBS 121410]